MSTTEQGAERRSVATDAIATLGTIIGPEQKRDAIHIAVEPVVAAHILRPGEHVGFVGDKKEVGVSCKNPVGIIDPFLTSPVLAGQTAWLFVYPRQITSLRHVWAHPAFGDESAPAGKSFSQRWMEEFAGTIPVHVPDLILHANDYLDSGEYWVEGGRFQGQDLPDVFWDHFEEITGRKVPQKNRGHFFSCSC